MIASVTDLPSAIQPDTVASPTAFPASFLENIGFVINKVAERTNYQVKHLMPNGLNRRQYGLLTLLQNEGPQAQIVLSQRVGVDPTNVMRTVDLLEKQGFVQRQKVQSPLSPTSPRAAPRFHVG